MILQRDSEVKIRGWSAPDEAISVRFMDSTYHTTANGSGEWSVLPGKFEAGGPYTMRITASNVIEISDILFGDVWICSGQSNMELPVRRVSWVYPDEIAEFENKYIRQFEVPDTYNFNTPLDDLPYGSWKSATPEHIMDFSAVAWFFARELYETLNVPIGLINASLGGSPAEAWMSEDALKEFPRYYDEMQKFKDSALIARIMHADRTRIRTWYEQLYRSDEGYRDKNNPWHHGDPDLSEWVSIQVPGLWSGTDMENLAGTVWYRRTFRVHPEAAGQSATLVLGRIVDADSVYINGHFIGSTGYQYPPRRYEIPPGILKEGENTIVVRVISNGGNGGFVPGKSYEITGPFGNIDLTGTWHCRVGTVMERLAGETFIRWKPGGLYNAMIAPLLHYSIKGVIWYQGEANAWNPGEYNALFSSLIKNWRTAWNQGDFPFLYVQLPNFMEALNTPSESNWALLREAQLKSLSVPNTAMAVAIDLGEWNDIHPLNKKDVGRRLALAARKVAYGDDNLTHSGPIYRSMTIKGRKIILSFSDTGSGLVFRKCNGAGPFAIAGADRQFFWAKAKIRNNKVIVWNKKIPDPVAVRYAWADNPEDANLYNKEGLPASPFRTDDWIIK
ncbi:MAG TPA: sialate O-acetylesterase [Bacteroidaceae bacterium]|nr:sialate O-acetylesterase [Bacteroidaceae bacterium]